MWFPYIPDLTFYFCFYEYILHRWRELSEAHLFLIPQNLYLVGTEETPRIKNPVKCWINSSLFHRNYVWAMWLLHSGPFMPVFSSFSECPAGLETLKYCLFLSMSWTFFKTCYFPFKSICSIQSLRSHWRDFHEYEGNKREKNRTCIF